MTTLRHYFWGPDTFVEWLLACLAYQRLITQLPTTTSSLLLTRPFCTSLPISTILSFLRRVLTTPHLLVLCVQSPTNARCTPNILPYVVRSSTNPNTRAKILRIWVARTNGCSAATDSGLHCLSCDDTVDGWNWGIGWLVSVCRVALTITLRSFSC